MKLGGLDNYYLENVHGSGSKGTFMRDERKYGSLQNNCTHHLKRSKELMKVNGVSKRD